MSWWIYLEGESVGSVDCIQEGGTQVMGGTDQPELNITYNYGELFRKAGLPDALKSLHEKRAGDTIEMLKAAVAFLGTNRYTKDYWAPTLGNAGFALSILLGWALKYPDGVWRVS